MPLKRTSITLTLERERPGPDGTVERVRLGAAFEHPADGPTPEELRAALGQLRSELDALGPSAPGTAPSVRSLEELVETYRPRQAELVELLREDGEITPAEAELLHGYVGRLATPSPPGAYLPVGVPPPTDRPIAAMPLEADRSPTTPRPIAQLLETYRIESLKQAGAVRARRQISFEEYMALKRHFAAEIPAPPTSEPHPASGG